MRNKLLTLVLFMVVLCGAGCVGNGAVSSGGADNQCNEPENPYSLGSGHYAGYQWGEEGNGCGGRSASFIEGCEEYERQEADYYSCMK